MNELRFALRQLQKAPGFSGLVLLTLTLGIAGSVVIFSIFNGLFLRPLPFKEADRLVDLDEQAPKWNLEYTGIAYADFFEWRAQNQTFDSMSVWQKASFNCSLKGTPERIEGGRVSHDMLHTLGLQPLLGRNFSPADDQPGANRVVLISHGLWRRLWGGEPTVLGETLSLDNVPATIIGVLPPNPGPLGRAEVLAPLRLRASDENGWYLEGIGRLKSGVTLETARLDLVRVHKAMIANRPANEITSPRVTPLRERLLGNYRPVTYVLIAAVGVVWLIACANVASLMLARGLGRAKEVSIRMALGAARGVVVRQLLVESLVLAIAGGVAGIAVGYSALGGLSNLLPAQFPNWIHFGMDGRFILFCVVTTAVTAAIFGLVPALQMVSNVNLQGALQATTTKSTGSAGHRRSLNALVVGEIALALVLLVNAGLLVQAFRALQKVDPGFRAENVLTYNLSLPRAAYTNTQQVAFFAEHLGEVRALHGVKSASATTIVPLGDEHSGTSTFFTIENAPPKAKDEQEPVVLQRHVFPGYAETMGLTVLSGRFFSDQDTRGAGINVVVVNESFAQLFWPKDEVIGKRIRYPGTNSPWFEIVGVVKDEKHYGFDVPMRPGVFLPYHLSPSRQMTITVRTAGDPLALFPPIRALVQQRDPSLPIFQVRTMAERVHSSLWLRRSYSWLFGFFAAVALLMALAGVYGVISYVVSQRTNEIGIRMALGAQRSHVLRLVLRHGLTLSAIGIALGLVGAFTLAQVTRRLLFGVNPTDPWTFITVPLLLGGVTLLACMLPARRASQVDPMIALRYE